MPKKFLVDIHISFEEPFDEKELRFYDSEEEYIESTIDYIKDELWMERINSDDYLDKTINVTIT